MNGGYNMPRRRTRISPYDSYLKAVEQTQGPNTVNPFRALRLNAGLGVQEFADEIGVSKQAIIRQEQGCNPEPIPGTVTWVVEHGYLTYPALMNGYADWQRDQRYRHAKLFGPAENWAFSDKVHPFATMRSYWTDPNGAPVGTSLNITEVAKLLCLNQGTLDHWEQRINHQAVVPAAFSRALIDNGYTRNDVRAIEWAFTKHRQWRLNGDADQLPAKGTSVIDELKSALR